MHPSFCGDLFGLTRFLRLCSDLWNVWRGLLLLLFLAIDLYTVKELYHHRCHHHNHHHHHSSCTEAMDKSPMHGMNNGMQGFLPSDTCCIALQLALEYARWHKVLVAGKIYHMVITSNIFVNGMKR
jgi:hypothetical protein